MWRRAIFAALLSLTVLSGTGSEAIFAQTLGPSPVLTLDQEQLFIGSAFGQRLVAEFEAASRALALENREIETRLAAEEQDLTKRRPSMSAEEFRPLSDDFDARVVRIRKEQDAKLAALSASNDQNRQKFFRAVAPVLADLMREAGAVALMDSRTVLLSADKIDITGLAIARIDADPGFGRSDQPQPPPADPPGAPGTAP